MVAVQDQALVELRKNLVSVRERMGAAAERSGRNAKDVKLVAVGKTRPVETLQRLISLGVRDLGENRVGELNAKEQAIGDKVNWHFIGGLQRNKVRRVVGRVELIHSVDRQELALEIDRQASLQGVVQPILIQVNVSGETSKQGIDLNNLEKLVAESHKLRHIRVDGLMTMAPHLADVEAVRFIFAKLKRSYDALARSSPLKWLSMGMTDDFEVAIEEGANLVRVGRAVFSPEHMEDR